MYLHPYPNLWNVLDFALPVTGARPARAPAVPAGAHMRVLATRALDALERAQLRAVGDGARARPARAGGSGSIPAGLPERTGARASRSGARSGLCGGRRRACRTP